MIFDQTVIKSLCMVKTTVPALYIPESQETLGPAMSALAPKQRAFVRALVVAGARSPSKAAQIAGYGGGDHAAAQRAYENMRNPKVLAAIREEADKRLRGGALLGAAVIEEIASDPMHKDRFRAAIELLNRSDLIVQTQHKVVVEDNRSNEEIAARAVALAQRLGLDPKALLENYGLTIEGEFTEVKTQDTDDDVLYTDETGRGGLEDLL